MAAASICTGEQQARWAPPAAAARAVPCGARATWLLPAARTSYSLLLLLVAACVVVYPTTRHGAVVLARCWYY